MPATRDSLMEIRRIASLLERGVICDLEFVNEFLRQIMAAELSAVDECLAELPKRLFPLVLKYLEEFAARDYFDDRHAYINDGRTLKERRVYYHGMQPHYRQIGDLLLGRLRDSGTLGGDS